jgi:hypothetical protein
MTHTHMQEFLTQKVLNFKNGKLSGFESDYLVDLALEETESEKVKNVCARLSIPLIEEIDNSIAILGCSKRRFIEVAVIEALRQFNDISKEWDIFDNYEKHTEEMKKMEGK